MYKTYLISLKSPNISKHHDQRKLTSVINKKTIRSHLNKFIGEYNTLPEERTLFTTVKHAAKTLFWTTVYLAFIYLTINSTFVVIKQYRDDEVKTNMKAVINNNVTYLPNMTICLKINAKKLFNVHSTSSFNYTSAWSRFFKKTVSPEGIFKVDEDQVYDDEIYLSLLKYLAMIYEAERAWEPGITQISTFHSNKSDDWMAMKKVLVPNIERFNITLEQLKSVFDGKFCSMPGYNENYNLLDLIYERSKKTECVAGSKISFIGMDTICFRLIGYKNSLRQLGTTEMITLELHEDCYNQTWCEEFTIDLGTESRSTPRRVTTQNETYAYYYNRYSCEGVMMIMMDIGVKALHRKLPYVKGDIQCSSDTTREECESKCLRGWIMANCHCSPITFNLTGDISSYRNCTVDKYSICLKKFLENATNFCTNKCVPLCEQWHYEYSLDTQGFVPVSAQIKLRTFDYVIIEQVFKWPSIEEFIGAFGGALGIWLGLDFVIIIEFIVKLLTTLIKKISLRKAPNSEKDEHQKSPNIKHREENVENGISSSNEIGSRVVGHQKKYKKNGNETDGTSIRRVSEIQMQRTSRKKRESNAVKEIHEQQRKRTNKNRVDSVILENEMKNTAAHGGHPGSHEVNITVNVDAVQDESTVHANNSSARNWFLQKVPQLLLNGDASTKKSVLFIRFVEKLFWTAIYLVGSIFTTRWCVQLINLYLANEAVYYHSLITNQTVPLPPPSLCIPYRNELYSVRQDNCFDVLMDYFSQSNVDRASFIQVSNGTAWPDPLVAMGLLYIGTLAAFETNYIDVSFVAEYGNQLNRATYGGNMPAKNDMDKSFNDIFLPKLLEWNVTANELRQKLGAEFARRAELKISFTNSNGATDIVKEASFYTTAITEDKFCYSLAYAVNFTDPDDSLEILIDGFSYSLLINTLKSNFIIFSDYLLEPKSAQFDIDDHNNVPVFDSTYIRFFYGLKTTIVFGVDGLYTSRPSTKGVTHCTLNTTQPYCRAQCRIQLIERLCNCSPTYWSTMIQRASGLHECTFDRYKKCLYFNASDDLNCKDYCLPSCTATYFRSERLEDTFHERYEETSIAVARFSLKESIYASIEEKARFTFSDMLIKV